jgi:AcrR family transcriptional regulator
MATTDIETTTRARTRTAILRAAVIILGQNQAAPLSEIADAAGVARSTLHRYFPERSDLIDALRRFADDESNRATARAKLDQGPALDALVRLCHEYFDIWDTLTWSYLDALGREPNPDDQWSDDETAALIARGYADGTIDPRMPAAWLQQLLWSLIYCGSEYVRQGASKHEALALTLDSLRRLASPPAPPAPDRR